MEKPDELPALVELEELSIFVEPEIPPCHGNRTNRGI